MTTIATVVGTRPELIRLSLIINKLDKYCHNILVHTGQNYDKNLSDIFFKELGIKEPDYYLGIREDSFGGQIGRILSESEKLFIKEKPDKILILGDTNSGLASIVAKRMGIPVYHMEAGNRCFDNRVPEEVNRKIIDHCSSIHMPYTQRSKENLLREGIPIQDIYVIGNPIYEIMHEYVKRDFPPHNIFDKLHLFKGHYFLATFHRAENVDDIDRLKNIIKGLNLIYRDFKQDVVVSLHPRTKNKLEQFKIGTDNLIMHEPFGFKDFIRLEQNARCVLTDSGTNSEETCILGTPCVTIRDVTERPEVIECGANILSGVNPDLMLQAVKIATNETQKWTPPEGYLDKNVSEKVIKIVLGY